MKHIRKPASILLTLVMLLGLLPWSAMPARAVNYCGDPGEDNGTKVTWTLDGAGKLTVSGEGAMADYGSDDRPWENVKDDIISVVIGEGVTKVGRNAFRGCSELESVALPASVTAVSADSESGLHPFALCPKLTEVDVDENNTAYGSIYGVLYELEDGAPVTLLLCPQGKTGSITVPATVTRLAEYSFFDTVNFTQLKRVEFASRSADSKIGLGTWNETGYTGSKNVFGFDYSGNCMLAAPENMMFTDLNTDEYPAKDAGWVPLAIREMTEWVKLQKAIDGAKDGKLTLTRSYDYKNDSYTFIGYQKERWYNYLNMPAGTELDLGTHGLIAGNISAEGNLSVKNGSLVCEPSNYLVLEDVMSGEEDSSTLTLSGVTLNESAANILNWYGTLDLKNSTATFTGANTWYPPESGDMLKLDAESSLIMPQQTFSEALGADMTGRVMFTYFAENTTADAVKEIYQNALGEFLPEGYKFKATTMDEGYYIVSVVDAEGGYPESVTFARQSETVKYDLWVGGTRVTSENAADIPAPEGARKAGTASYDAASNTLTLKDYAFTGPGYVFEKDSKTYAGAIWYDGTEPLTVTLSGTSMVMQSSGTAPYGAYGIRSSAPLSINGTGMLLIGGGAATADSFGIYTVKADKKDNGITISGAQILATSGAVEAEVEPGTRSFAVFCGGTMTVENEAELACTGDKARSSRGLFSADNLTVSDAYVLGQSGTAREESCGVYCGKSVTVSGRESALCGYAGSVTGYTDNTGDFYRSIGLYINNYSGDSVSNEGVIIGLGGEASAENGISVGIFFYCANKMKEMSLAGAAYGGKGGEATGTNAESYGVYCDLGPMRRDPAELTVLNITENTSLYFTGRTRAIYNYVKNADVGMYLDPDTVKWTLLEAKTDKARALGYQMISIPKLTVSFDPNGGSGEMAAQDIPFGVKAPINANTFTAPAGKVFDCWNTKADGTDRSVEDGESIELDEDTTLYAQWAVGGYCGDPAVNEGGDVSWKLREGALIITGTGDMANYGIAAPWDSYRGSITSVVVGEGVTSIGQRAFDGCSKLETVTLPSSVTKIVDSGDILPFKGCTSLKEINVNGDNTAFCSTDGVLYRLENGKPVTLLLCPLGKTGTITVPATVTCFYVYSFFDGTNYTQLQCIDLSEFSTDSRPGLGKWNESKSKYTSTQYVFGSGYSGDCLMTAPKGLIFAGLNTGNATIKAIVDFSRLAFHTETEWSKLEKAIAAAEDGKYTLTRSYDYMTDSYYFIESGEKTWCAELMLRGDTELDLGGNRLNTEGIAFYGDAVIKNGRLNAILLNIDLDALYDGKFSSDSLTLENLTVNDPSDTGLSDVLEDATLIWYGSLELKNSTAYMTGMLNVMHPNGCEEMLKMDSASSMTLKQTDMGEMTGGLLECHSTIMCILDDFEIGEDEIAALYREQLGKYLPEGYKFEAVRVEQPESTLVGFYIGVTDAEGNYPESVTLALPPVTAPSVSLNGEFAGDKLLARFFAPKSGTLIAAEYDENGKLVSTTAHGTFVYNAEQCIDTGLTKTSGHTYKLMLVDSSFAPQCAAWDSTERQ